MDEESTDTRDGSINANTLMTETNSVNTRHM